MTKRTHVGLHDQSEDGDSFACVWCQHAGHLGDLIGEGTNQCPACGNPTIRVPFSALSRGTTFVCVNGGKWRKHGTHRAECIEDDSAYRHGDRAQFRSQEFVYPY